MNGGGSENRVGVDRIGRRYPDGVRRGDRSAFAGRRRLQGGAVVISAWWLLLLVPALGVGFVAGVWLVDLAIRMKGT